MLIEHFVCCRLRFCIQIIFTSSELWLNIDTHLSRKSGYAWCVQSCKSDDYAGLVLPGELQSGFFFKVIHTSASQDPKILLQTHSWSWTIVYSFRVWPFSHIHIWYRLSFWQSSHGPLLLHMKYELCAVKILFQFPFPLSVAIASCQFLASANITFHDHNNDVTVVFMTLSLCLNSLYDLIFLNS